MDFYTVIKNINSCTICIIIITIFRKQKLKKEQLCQTRDFLLYHTCICFSWILVHSVHFSKCPSLGGYYEFSIVSKSYSNYYLGRGEGKRNADNWTKCIATGLYNVHRCNWRQLIVRSIQVGDETLEWL